MNNSNVTNGPSPDSFSKVVINGNLQDELSHPLSSLKAIINGNLQGALPYPENVYNTDMNMGNARNKLNIL